MDSASQMKVDPIIFFDASGLAIDSGVRTAPATPVTKKMNESLENAFRATHG